MALERADKEDHGKFAHKRWLIYMSAAQDIITNSRLVQFVLNFFSALLSVSLLQENVNFTLACIVCLLLPIALVHSLSWVIMLGKMMDIKDLRDFGHSSKHTLYNKVIKYLKDKEEGKVDNQDENLLKRRRELLDTEFPNLSTEEKIKLSHHETWGADNQPTGRPSLNPAMLDDMLDHCSRESEIEEGVELGKISRKHPVSNPLHTSGGSTPRVSLIHRDIIPDAKHLSSVSNNDLDDGDSSTGSHDHKSLATRKAFHRAHGSKTSVLSINHAQAQGRTNEHGKQSPTQQPSESTRFPTAMLSLSPPPILETHIPPPLRSQLQGIRRYPDGGEQRFMLTAQPLVSQQQVSTGSEGGRRIRPQQSSVTRGATGASSGQGHK